MRLSALHSSSVGSTVRSPGPQAGSQRSTWWPRGFRMLRSTDAPIDHSSSSSVSIKILPNNPPSKTLERQPSFKRDQAEAQLSPEVEALSPRKERLFSCPDDLHHPEGEILARLQTLFQLDSPIAVPASDALQHHFDGRRVPKQTLYDYLKRIIFHLSNLAESERTSGHDVAIHSDLAARYLIASHILIDKLRAKQRLVTTPLNVHRLLLAALVIAAKILDDVQPGLAYFALLGGVTQEELSKLEVAFLTLLAFDVQVDANLFEQKYRDLLASSYPEASPQRDTLMKESEM